MDKKTLQRKQVEIGKKRIPLRKLLHGKEIRAGAKALEDFRLQLNEQEMLFGAKLTIKMEPYGEAVLIASRLETDNEYEKRLEAHRIAEEQKAERARKRKLVEAERQKRLEQERKGSAVESIRRMIIANGLTPEDLAKMGIV